MKTQSNKYYLIIPYKIEIKQEKKEQTDLNKIVSIDPGMRNFVSLYNINEKMWIKENYVEK